MESGAALGDLVIADDDVAFLDLLVKAFRRDFTVHAAPDGARAIHALLATGAVHHGLVDAGLRCACNLIIETGTVRDAHHVACLVGVGATFVYPYLAYQTLRAMQRHGQLTLPGDAKEPGRRFRRGVKKGLLKNPPHVQFVLGIANALPVRRSVFDFLRSELAEVLPGATWVAAGTSRHQFEVNQWCLEAGGHCRTGLEDNLRFDPTRLAASNAELVKKIVDVCDRYGRRPATAGEAREILGLRTG